MSRSFIRFHGVQDPPMPIFGYSITWIYDSHRQEQYPHFNVIWDLFQLTSRTKTKRQESLIGQFTKSSEWIKRRDDHRPTQNLPYSDRDSRISASLSWQLWVTSWTIGLRPTDHNARLMFFLKNKISTEYINMKKNYVYHQSVYNTTNIQELSPVSILCQHVAATGCRFTFLIRIWQSDQWQGLYLSRLQ